MPVLVLDAARKTIRSQFARSWRRAGHRARVDGFRRRAALRARAGSTRRGRLCSTPTKRSTTCCATRSQAPREDADAYRVYRTTYFCGKPMRLWSREPLDPALSNATASPRRRFPPAAAVPPCTSAGSSDGPVRRLDGTLLHYSYPDVATYRAKYDRYTSTRRPVLPRSLPRLLRSGDRSVRLRWLLLERGALLDGWRGVYVAYSSALYPAVVAWKALRRRCTPDDGRRRIGLDGRMTRQMSVGMKTYVRELIARLPRSRRSSSLRFSSGVRTSGTTSRSGCRCAMRRSRLDLRCTSCRCTSRSSRPSRSVITIHDVIHLRFPQYFKAKVRPVLRDRRASGVRARQARDHRRRAHGRRPERHFLERRPAQSTSRSARRCASVFYAAARRRLRRRSRTCSTWVITDAHKNLPTLFKAWSALPEDAEVDLYLTGPDDFGGELERRRRPARQISRLGQVATEELIAYYGGARGAGCSRHSARGSGCRCSRRWPPAARSSPAEDAVPRVLEPAALTFAAPERRGVERALGGPREGPGPRDRFVKRGRRSRAKLTWDRCARATADVYAEVLEDAC